MVLVNAIHPDASGKVTCPFDHHADTYGEEFREILDGLREVRPIVWSESYGGFWIATSYAAVRRLAIDSATFTVAPGPDRTGGLRIPPPPGLKTRPLFVPGETDGQEHDEYRLALNPHFSKACVADMVPMIHAHVTSAVDGIVDRDDGDEIDVIEDLIVPVLSGIACEHLGLDVDDPPEFFRDMHRMVSMTPSTDGEFDVIRQRFEASWHRLQQVVAARRSSPRDDVISHLVVHASPAFTNAQVEMMTLNVILGAFHTTSSLLSQIIIHLDGDRRLREHHREHPELLPKAVDEFLRLKAVSISVGRTPPPTSRSKDAPSRKATASCWRSPARTTTHRSTRTQPTSTSRGDRPSISGWASAPTSASVPGLPRA